MPEGSLITDELKKLIGVPWEPQIFKVEEGAIKRYAEAIDDPNPLYNDAEYARKSAYGRLICPPGFTGWPDRKAKLLGIQVQSQFLGAFIKVLHTRPLKRCQLYRLLTITLKTIRA